LLSIIINITIFLLFHSLQTLFTNNQFFNSVKLLQSTTMRFNVFIIPALAAMVAAHPTKASTAGDLVARDEYRWCLGS
jgi:hypothetical protein